MSAAPDANIRIRILGGIKAALEVDTVARAIDDLKDKTETLALAAMYANDRMKKLQRTLLKTYGATVALRLGFLRLSISLTATSVIAWGLASIVLPALIASLWSTAVAASTLAVAFIGGFIAIGAAAGLMAVGVIGRFKQMSGVIGSAANDLQNAGYAVRGAFRDATAKGSDRLMEGLARGLQKLVPLLRTLAPSFTAIGTAFGQMFENLFGQLAGMGPELRRMFRELVPVIHSTGDMLASLLGFLIQIGTIGAPLVADAFDWLDKKLTKWTKSFTSGDIDRAKDQLRSFAAGVKAFTREFIKPIKPVLGDSMKDVGDTWRQIAPELGHLLGVVVAGFMKFGQDVLPLVAGAIKGLSSIVGEHGNRIRTLLWAVLAIGATLKAFTLIVGAVKAAMLLWRAAAIGVNIAMWALSANPLGALITAVVAVGVAFYEAYKNVKLFRDAVNSYGSAFGIGPTADKKPGPVKKIGQDALLNAIPGIGPILGLGKNILGHAGGGTMTRGGLTWVGERGKELVNLPAAATVFPAAESRAIAAGERPQQAAQAPAPGLPPVQWNLVLPGLGTLAKGIKDFNTGQAALEG